MAAIFLGESFHHFRTELVLRKDEYLLTNDELNELFSSKINDVIQSSLKKDLYDKVAFEVLKGNYGILGTDDFNEIRDKYQKIADNIVYPHAERVHRHDEFIPDEIIQVLIENGATC